MWGDLVNKYLISDYHESYTVVRTREENMNKFFKNLGACSLLRMKVNLPKGVMSPVVGGN